MTYQRDFNRPPTVKLALEEWTSIVTEIVLVLGQANAVQVLQDAIGTERTSALLERREGTTISKEDTHRIVRGLYPLIPGDNRSAKEGWLIQFGRDVFGDDDRFMEVLAYIRHRVGEFEDAGGDLNTFPKPLAAPRVQAVMVTPIFSMRDGNVVTTQAKQIASSSRFNAVVGLVDLQSGRDYIVPGRTTTDLTPRAKENINRVLDEGITPIIITRNDWAVRTNTGTIPSGNPPSAPAFYSASWLEQEKIFLNNLRELFPSIHIQLSIEPEIVESATFALNLAQYLRSVGFNNRILVNPVGTASSVHESMKGAFVDSGVDFARSRGGSDLGNDEIVNTDGNRAITESNFNSDWWPEIAATGRDYIVWSQELSNSPGALPSGYFSTAQEISGNESGFLWKPVSEHGKLVVLLPSEFTHKTSRVLTLTDGNGVVETSNRAHNDRVQPNGNREHYRFNRVGAAYASPVTLRIEAGGVDLSWRIDSPGSRTEDLAARRDGS